MNARARTRFAVLLGLLLALSGCGGGSDEDETRAGTQPVNCTARPDLCR